MLWRRWLVASMLMLAGWGISMSVVGMGVPQIQYLSHEQFLEQAFAGEKPHWKMLMLSPELKQKVATLLQHPYPGTRIRYWMAGQRTAWIIDEIGKEMPITIGVVLEQDKIQQIHIMVYREERGEEVHQDFFTRQFNQLSLTGEDRLARSIDGITGATLSVNAVTRVANMALVLHRYVVNTHNN